MNISPIIKDLGLVPYEETLSKMQTFTQNRGPDTPDEIWFLEHPPVFTLGQAGKKEHLLTSTNIPVIHTDRGGQITYHGPGQIVVYLLIDVKRLNYNIRQLVSLIEQAVINTLNHLHISSYNDPCAPGVYVDLDGLVPNQKIRAKICSLGLRIRRGCTYHGLALNYDMDLAPFNYINPCGFQNLKVTQITSFTHQFTKEQIINTLCDELITKITYKEQA